GMACGNGHVDVVRMLLADGRANPADERNRPFRCCVRRGQAAVLALLLADGRVDPTANDNYAVRISVENEHTEVVRLLLTDTRVVPDADRIMEDFLLVDNELQAKVEAADRIMEDFTMDDNEKPRVEVDPHFSPTLGNKKREEEAAEKRRKENEKNADINFLAVRIVNRDPEEWKAILTLLFYHHTSNLQHIKYQNIKSASPNASDFYILCRALEEVANAGFGAIDSFCGLLVSHGYKVMNSDVDLMRTINVHSQYYYSHYMDTGEKLYVKEDWDAMLLENLELGKKKFAEYEKKEQLYRNKREKQRKERKERKEAAEKERKEAAEKEAVEKLYVVTGTVPV
ncbi:hypothetical protein LCGC14_3122730, partial [marine sediment metagenome]